MPIYEYLCSACQQQFEVFQGINEPLLEKCPACKKKKLKKLISNTAFQLKGDGWYVTDFRDKNKPKPKTENQTAETKQTAEKNTTTDNKKADTTKQEKTTETKKKSSSSGANKE